MQPIEIDFDVFKALTALRQSEGDSYNDVLRRLLRLENDAPVPRTDDDSGAFVAKGVRLPEGTQLRARYKGVVYSASIEGGAIVIAGQRARSPSQAAHVVTGTNVNGWTFWEVRLPGESAWRPIVSLRTPGH